jgi:hypothetical protein
MHKNGSPRPAIIRDRGLFLRALQNCAPEFWRSFRQSCLEGDRLSPKEWAICARVEDDWLIQVLRDTLARWIEQPDHGGSQLQPGYEWFVYAESIPIAPFAPTFDNPYLLFNGRTPRPELTTNIEGPERKAIARSQRIETADEFGRRMTEQFKKQLAEHKACLRHVSPAGDNRSQRSDHAEWTALVFSRRATVAEIAEKWLSLVRNEDAYATVHKGVERFSADIGLSIGKWTKT